MAPGRLVRVALAGATGNLGRPVLVALLEHHDVTVLSRIGGSSSKLQPHPCLTVRQVDFASADSIAAALTEDAVEVVVSCLATLAIGAQNPLIDACIATGVKRFIPAEFGMNSKNSLCAQLPVCAPKVSTQQYLQETTQSHPEFSWTGIANGLFLDWGIKEGIIIDTKHHTAELYNGGNIVFSATRLCDVARAIVAVVRDYTSPDTANRLLYIHSTVTTQNELIEYAKNVDGKQWTTTQKDTETVLQESYALLRNGSDVMGAMNGFCVAASWTPAYGCDFSSHLDNALLGIEMMDPAAVQIFVRDLVVQ